MPDCFTSSTTFPKSQEQYIVEDLSQEVFNHKQILISF